MDKVNKFDLISMNLTTIQSGVRLVMELGQSQFNIDANIDCGTPRVKLWQKACITMQEMTRLAGELAATVKIIEELPDA